MIERVVIDGEDTALGAVFASVTIRHGRASADDAPLASTCSLVLVNVDRELASSFRVAAPLELYLADDVPRFRGRITDAALTPEGLSIVAVSSLGWRASRTVGLVDWPAEKWSLRVSRVLFEAGYVVAWTELPGTWAGTDGSWFEPGSEPPFVVELGDADPIIAARAADPVTAGQALTDLAQAEPAAIANLPSGAVLVQALSARRDRARVELDPSVVAWAPEWTMVDELENSVTVKWDGGEVVAEDAASIALLDERRPVTIDTALATEADALALAGLRVARRSQPEWLVESAELLELDVSIGIGSPVVLQELPDWAPSPEYLGMIEGWEDRIEPAAGDGLEWTMALALSAPRLSGSGAEWQDVPTTWAAALSTWFSPIF